MAATITEQDVIRIARLARLQLARDEIRRFAAQLAEILAYADQVQQVDTTAVVAADPAAGAEEDALRDDVVHAGLSRDEALANAPDTDRDGGFFKVPKVLG